MGLAEMKKVFTKTVETGIELEAELQSIAARYGFAPQVLDTTDKTISMVDLDALCVADKYGVTTCPDWIFDQIRNIIHTLLNEEGIEYRDITGYNFIEREGVVSIIDFGHARYIEGRDVDEFVQKFLDGANEWNPDFE